MSNFDNTTVIVTGGGGGIGGATCRRFGAAGARVAVFDRDLAAAQQVAEAIRSQGGRRQPSPATSPTARRSMPP